MSECIISEWCSRRTEVKKLAATASSWAHNSHCVSVTEHFKEQLTAPAPCNGVKAATDTYSNLTGCVIAQGFTRGCL